MSKKYVSRPVEIEAIQFTGSIDNRVAIEDFIGEFKDIFKWDTNGSSYMEILTIEGSMKLIKGNYLVKGIENEFYPCKKSIFEAKYQEVTSGS